MTTDASSRAATQPLPNFSSAEAASAWLSRLNPEPRRRTPRDTASLAVTAPMPVIGRAGSREWTRNAAPCFGGEECR